MSKNEQTNLIENARGLANWLSVDVEVKIFGVTILHFTYPPKNKKS